MPIKENRYFNDPGFAQAASNLATLFAPPSGQEAHGWAAANAKNAEARRLADFYAKSLDSTVDRQTLDRIGIGAGVYNPTQGYYAVDQTQQTSRANNAADNQRALEQTRLSNEKDVTTTLLAPVAEGATRFVPPSLSKMYDIDPTQVGVIKATPGDRIVTPDGRTIEGAPKPLNESEFRAQQEARLLASGQLTDTDLLDAINGKETPVKVLGADGKPVFSTPGAAVRQNAPAYVDKGAQAKPTNGTALLADGTQVPARQDENGQWVHAQTGQQLPADVQVFDMSKATGTADQVGLTKTVNSSVQQQLLDTSVAKNTAVALRNLIASNPASQGMVGWMRGTAQNFIQSGGEVAKQFGGQVEQIQQRIAQNLEQNDLGGAFDKNIPAIDMMANLLAFQYAKTTTGERLSNEMLKASRKALGLEGLDANQANSLARIDTAIERMQAQEDILNGALKKGIGAVTVPAPPAPEVNTTIVPPTSAGQNAPIRYERGPDGTPRRVQ